MNNLTLVAVVLAATVAVARPAEAQIPEELEALNRMVLDLAENQDEPEPSTLTFQPHVVSKTDGRVRIPFAVNLNRDEIRSRRVGMLVRFVPRQGGSSRSLPADGIEMPRPILQARPEYTDRAMRAHIHGSLRGGCDREGRDGW